MWKNLAPILAVLLLCGCVSSGPKVIKVEDMPTTTVASQATTSTMHETVSTSTPPEVSTSNQKPTSTTIDMESIERLLPTTTTQPNYPGKVVFEVLKPSSETVFVSVAEEQEDQYQIATVDTFIFGILRIDEKPDGYYADILILDNYTQKGKTIYRVDDKGLNKEYRNYKFKIDTVYNTDEEDKRLKPFALGEEIFHKVFGVSGFQHLTPLSEQKWSRKSKVVTLGFLNRQAYPILIQKVSVKDASSGRVACGRQLDETIEPTRRLSFEIESCDFYREGEDIPVMVDMVYRLENNGIVKKSTGRLILKEKF